jgi:beta-galactosidase
MFIGGTNFGFTNGADGRATQFIATSYDFDAMLSEAGDMTWKYQQTLATIKKYRSNIPVYDVKNSTKRKYGTVSFTQGCSIWEGLPVLTINETQSTHPISMEDLNVPSGFTLYQTTTRGGTLQLTVLRDRASILVNKKYIDMIVGSGREHTVKIPKGTLDVLVQNQGRPNGGTDMSKGLLGSVTIDDMVLEGWKNIGLDVNLVHKLPWSTKLETKVPSFYRTTFQVDEVGDTFLNPKGWVQGVAWVNGFNLGKYWTIGPQLTLYVPAALLHSGENELIIFEFMSQADAIGTMSFDDVHQININ